MALPVPTFLLILMSISFVRYLKLPKTSKISDLTALPPGVPLPPGVNQIAVDKYIYLSTYVHRGLG